MGLLAVKPATADPRCQPLAYITNGTNLAEVIEIKTIGSRDMAILEDCMTNDRRQVELYRIIADWKLVRAAPSKCPEAC